MTGLVRIVLAVLVCHLGAGCTGSGDAPPTLNTDDRAAVAKQLGDDAELDLSFTPQKKERSKSK